MSTLEQADAAAAAVQKTPNRVSADDIDAAIAEVEFMHPRTAAFLTLAVVTMANGYVVVGRSAPADPGNFDEELGKKFAVEDATRQIWPLLGYALRDRLHNDRLDNDPDEAPERTDPQGAVGVSL